MTEQIALFLLRDYWYKKVHKNGEIYYNKTAKEYFLYAI